MKIYIEREKVRAKRENVILLPGEGREERKVVVLYGFINAV